MNIPAHFNVVPMCMIQNKNITETNKEFDREFSYPATEIILNITDKSIQTINNKTYSVYNIGDETIDVLLFFNKEYLPDLSNKCNNVKKLSPININELYLTKVLCIDNQHIELVNCVNTIITTLKSGCALEDTLFHLQYLIGHTKEHFKFEEEIMKVNGFCMPEHVIEHQELIETVVSLLYNINMENLVSSIDYLKNWLLDHIMVHDKILGETIKNKNLIEPLTTF